MSNTALKVVWSSLTAFLIYTLYMLYEFDVLSKVYHADVSKLTVVILGVFLIGWGNLTRLVFKKTSVELSNLDFGYEMADICTALGMLGTVIGFIVMTSSFSEFDFSNTESVREFLRSCAVGMSTKLYTTATGLICTMLLRTSSFFIGKITKVL